MNPPLSACVFIPENCETLSASLPEPWNTSTTGVGRWEA